MLIADKNTIAKEKARKFAIEHPFADGWTARQWAARWFETDEERETFIRAWTTER